MLLDELKDELHELENHSRALRTAEKGAIEKAKSLEFELKSSNKMTKTLRSEVQKLQKMQAPSGKPPGPSFKKSAPSLSLADELNPPEIMEPEKPKVKVPGLNMDSLFNGSPNTS